MPDNDWHAADRRNRDRAQAQQAAARAQQAQAATERRRQLQIHEAGTAPINRMIAQFIRAIRGAGSPGLQVKKGALDYSSGFGGMPRP